MSRVREDETRTLTISLPRQWWEIIDRLVAADDYSNTVDDFVARLLDHVQQGVYRSGDWERGWLCSVVSEEVIEAAYDPEDDPINQRWKEDR